MTDELRDLNEHLAERVDEKVREVERLTMLRRFVSPQLAEAIASGGESILASHRREITVPFCDLRGFTSFAETAEPEEVMAVLREFHEAVGPMIFAYDGTIAQFTGDGMLVVFNDPVKLDDPSWNAVQLAIDMRERTAELSTSRASPGPCQSWRLSASEVTHLTRLYILVKVLEWLPPSPRLKPRVGFRTYCVERRPARRSS